MPDPLHTCLRAACELKPMCWLVGKVINGRSEWDSKFIDTLSRDI